VLIESPVPRNKGPGEKGVNHGEWNPVPYIRASIIDAAHALRVTPGKSNRAGGLGRPGPMRTSVVILAEKKRPEGK